MPCPTGEGQGIPVGRLLQEAASHGGGWASISPASGLTFRRTVSEEDGQCPDPVGRQEVARPGDHFRLRPESGGELVAETRGDDRIVVRAEHPDRAQPRAQRTGIQPLVEGVLLRCPLTVAGEELVQCLDRQQHQLEETRRALRALG